ncbi:CaiB/BaiF CoA-transferase family protein [Amphritea sp. 2_MG-2023]|uniref:CaiB/BaiF CoA transferase family protein n=1 Tax=Amphritea TaxID=515417 RepID=UPI001C072F65|nr:MULTISPECIES: CaiB/BaiF CoA-transferase family protein [Amphritea]MBU2966331.1 CoA transferase [Amphritea atlantica]MDO6419770.1 CaiB/BaiF CoA-transferase family protein [Amphritea sp. 2_MG-2023]
MKEPLKGLKVLDLSTLLPGPYATMMLADLGAEVLRVESASRHDLVRNMKPLIDGQSAAFSYLNRGKQSLALNLKHPEAIGLISQLVAEYDILIEQFRPGVMARLGLDYDTLKQVNPRLIYCSITGYGQTGPYRDKAGHDLNYLALSGAASHMGRKASGPAPMGLQVADVAAGSHPAVISILAAVIGRQSSGEGCYLDISMADNTLALQALMIPAALNGAPDPQPESNFLNGGGVYDYYRTADDRYLSVGSLEPQFRQRLARALNIQDNPPLEDRQLKTLLQQKFAKQDLETWCEELAEQDICVEPVLTVSEAAEHPQFIARNMIVTQPSGERQVDSALGFEQQPIQPAPRCGEQGAQVMERLGYSQTEIDKLRDAGLFD